MATPNETYQHIVASIKDPEIRLVAAIMSDHIGQDNAATIQQISLRAGLSTIDEDGNYISADRKIRKILEILVKDYGIPIGAQSGKAGRFIIATEEERQAVIADLRSRNAETEKRTKALQRATLIQTPPVEPELEQGLLFDLPEPRRATSDAYINQWGW